MSIVKGLESAFLDSWGGWDEGGGIGDLQFYELVFNKETINIFEAEGVDYKKITYLWLSSSDSIVECYDDDGGVLFSKKVKLTIV